jgi:hypothetical protein
LLQKYTVSLRRSVFVTQFPAYYVYDSEKTLFGGRV